MKLAPLTSNVPHKEFVSPAITMYKDILPKAGDEEKMSIQLRMIPTDENSKTFRKTVRVFSTGQPEEYLQWKNALQTCIIGQHATTGPTQYAMARRLLSGYALTTFENASTEVATETVATFKTALHALRTHVFPRKALHSQKRYMRRHMRKTRDISARVFVARIQEVNNYLNSFPPFAEGQKLDDYELLEIMEASVPKNWQRVFTQQGYDPAENAGGIEKFLDFCKRVEFSEEVTSKNNYRVSKKTEKRIRTLFPIRKSRDRTNPPTAITSGPERTALESTVHCMKRTCMTFRNAKSCLRKPKRCVKHMATRTRLVSLKRTMEEDVNEKTGMPYSKNSLKKRCLKKAIKKDPFGANK